MNIKEEIIRYISIKSKIPTRELSEDTGIYNSGIISSLNLLELMSHIEKKYNIIINPEELREENFKDTHTLSKFIQSKITENNDFKSDKRMYS